ncbi:helix-turn-helix domain-containing protein [Dethiosulfatarculus sandiegensis]|uniref:helix-turn-helix domain-containing protein n=1 Tax=Dethiosulfatarculus sandiegensis TaxID=1429043 RepID=UPI0018D0C7D8|nr:AraC family transcriptional regulator [Dethiosulfatarculus sandiegensis]
MRSKVISSPQKSNYLINRYVNQPESGPPPKARLKEKKETGALQVIHIKPGLEITICDQYHSKGLNVDFDIYESPVSLSYNLNLPIRCSMKHDNGGKTVMERAAGESLLAFLPKTKGGTQSPSGRLTGLSVYISKSLFRGLFAKLPEPLADLDRPSFGNSSEKTFQYQSPIEGETLLILKQIMNCPFQGDLGNIYLEGKVLELIARQLHKLGSMHHEACTDFYPKDLERAREAYHILLKRIERPPSLQDLSLMVGMNRNKLNHCFKQLYGGTVFNVLRQARLSKALSLLHETDSSLSEIALSVGYSDQANFCNAFRRHFGQTPNLVRRKGLAGISVH